jgi:LacI family transcriptional regulator
VADRSDTPGLNYVYADSRTDSVRAVEHLIFQGHTRIALGAHTVMDSDHRDREAGYLEALDKHGIAIDQDLIVPLPSSPDSGAADHRPRALARRPRDRGLLHHPALDRRRAAPLPRAVDPRAPGVLDRRVRRQEVRKRTFPPYTSVCQNAEQLGVEAARWLTRSLNDAKQHALRIKHATRFEINGSTGNRPTHPLRLRSDGVVLRKS